ncbi:MAG: hypothetical protein ACLU4J_08720 [Butyricimonas paravirosa]
MIGSDCADVDIYGIREYDSGLTSQGVLTNYINWLSDSAEKARVRLYNDILDGNGSEVDFDNSGISLIVSCLTTRFPRWPTDGTGGEPGSAVHGLTRNGTFRFPGSRRKDKARRR